VVAAIAVGAAACGSGGGDGGDVPALPAEGLFLPPEEVGELRRLELTLAEDAGSFDTGVVPPVMVERTDAGVVVVIVRDRAELAEASAGRDIFSDATGPVIGLGPSYTGSGDFEAAVTWPASEELAIEMASHELTEAELVDLARQVELGADGRPVLPTEPVGRLPGSLETPVPGVVASYSDDPDRSGDRVVVHPATPEVQAAYRAVLIGRPREAESVRTAASCCTPAIYEAPRTVEVGGREATAGTITPYRRVLIVPGDPGIVLAGNGALDDSELAAIAAAVEPADIGEVRRIIDREREAETERLVDAATASEAASGYQVLQRWDGESAGLLTFGTTPRPDGHRGAPGRPTLCGVLAAPVPTATCLPVDPPAVVEEAPDAALSGVRWGLVGDGVAAVRLEFPERDVETDITEVEVPGVGPVRIFHVVLTVEDQIELMGDMTSQDFARTALVATDSDGREVARIPLVPER
jgi:hypothetical protein